MGNLNEYTVYLMCMILLGSNLLFSQGGQVDHDNVAEKIEEAWKLVNGERTKSYIQAKQILDFSQKNGLVESEAESKAILGVLEMHRGDWQRSSQLLDEALAIWENLKKRDKIASIFNKLMLLKNLEGKPDTAFAYGEQALKVLKKKDNIIKGYTYLYLANLFADNRDSLAAIEHYKMAEEIFSKNKKPEDIAIAKYELANFYFNYKKYEAAILILDETLPYFEKEKNLQYFALANNVLGACYFQKANDDIPLARKKYNTSIQSAVLLGDSLIQFDGYINLCIIDQYEENYLGALDYANQAKQVLGSKGGTVDSIYLFEQYKDIYNELKEFDKAYKAVVEVLNCQDRLYNKNVFKAQEKSKLLSTNLVRTKAEKAQFQILGVGVFLLLIAMWRMNYLKQRNQAARKTNLMLLQQKELKHQQREFELQKEIDEMILRQQVATARARLNGEKKERERIAANIHDRLGSQLAAMRWSLESSIVKSNEAIAPDPIKATLSVLNKTHKDLRVIVKELELDNFEWKAEIESFLGYIQKSKKIKTKLFTYGLDKPINRELSEDVYDILLQLIGNVLEHSNAGQLNIEINHLDGEEINILLEDNGKGFLNTPVLIKDLEGSGLKNIENKVMVLNGSIDIDSKPGHGTTVNIVIPVKSDKS